ncbi:MAG: GHKL domain-containing protein, partial [Acidobacteria bacterium]
DLTELISAQRAAAWSEVARRMAHEIKNPLTPIQLSAERMARKFETLVAEENDEKLTSLKKVITDGTDIILSEVKSLKSMVDEFSKFARLPNAKLEIGNLNDVVRRTLLLYEDRSAEISIKVELLDHLPDCMLDVEQMKQVLVNLIDNAIEAFEPDQKNKEIRIRTNFDQKEAKIVLEVSDNAVGINPEHFPKLFQPYFSTKNGGTGLGLAIVQRIITEHSGKISVVKNYPRGTRFRIELAPA